MRWSKGINGVIIILIIHTTSAKSSKDTGPAVFEVTNEQSRIDEKRVLPYTNPLAGNSQQNAKIHARHQQDMFNAERKRQQRAQLQRWNMQPPKQQVDSYMQAYQESQESHHLALEQMQTKLNEKRAKTRPLQLKETPEIEPVKITRADAIDKNRNHRSYGSGHVQKKRRVYAYPGASYEQGVTIKPNGNVGLYKIEKEPRSLYTVAIPSKTQYVYPKQYSQTHGYTPKNNLNALTSILGKLPKEHVSQLNTLMQSPENTDKETLTKPIDLYFYVNDPHIPNIDPAQTVVSKPYAPEFITHKDHIPITEEIDDVPDVRDPPQSFFKPVAPTVTHIINDATVPQHSYYNLQVEQTDTNDLHKNIEYISPVTPTQETIIYEKPLKLYQLGPSTEGVKYLQSKPTAVQHLTQDGTGVSAYGDSDVSSHKNRTKRDLDTTLFVLGNETAINEKVFIVNVTELSNQTIHLDINNTYTKLTNNTQFENATIDFVSEDGLPISDELKRNGFIEYDSSHRIGEAYDYDYTYDEDDPNSKLDYSYESNEDYEYSIPDFDYEPRDVRIRPTHRPRQRNPNKNDDTDGSFSTRYNNFRHPNFYDYHSDSTNRDYREPKQQYGPPRHYNSPNQQYGPPKQQYGPPKQQYGPPKQQYGVPNQQYNMPSPHYGQPLEYDSGNQYEPPSTNYGLPVVQYGPPFNPTTQSYPASHVSSVIDNLEPVYMLTHSQLKELVGQKLNIEHLDVFQLPHGKKSKRPRKHKSRRRYPKRGRGKKVRKVRKLNKLAGYQ